MRKSLDPVQRLTEWLRKLESRVKSLETTPRLQNASISKGALRILSDEGLIVVGSARIDGVLTGSGSFNWDGDMNLTGSQTITGPTTFTGTLTVNGAWSLDGNGDITGNVDLTGDFRVATGGRILVDDMVIDPTGGGSVTFPGGAVVQADPGGGIRVTQGTNRVYVGAGLVSMQNGSRTFGISSSGFTINNIPTIPASSANGAVEGTLWVDSFGSLFRVIP